jgi:tetratricopeptide (TPR) repeat protein
MKAFLSHSHHDEAIVHAVAQQVGRAFVTIDTAAFKASDELIRAIEQAVRDSAIFVFFASRHSLGSAFVTFELSEARYRQAISRVRKLLVVRLDDRLQISDLPEWMQHNVTITSHSARPIARVIRGAIDEMVADEQSGYFVGRASEGAALQAAFVPPDASADVSVVTVRGLPGIGRRTLLQRVAKDTLFIERLLVVRVQVGDNVNSITAKLADLVEPVITAEDTLTMTRQIQAMASEIACERFASEVGQALQLKELVVLYDEGGALDEDGSPTDEIVALLREVTKLPDRLIALVTNRRPRFHGIPDLEESPIVDVGPLHESEVRQLLALMARANKLCFTPEATASLAAQAKGYPPSVTALVELAVRYGADLAASSTSWGPDYYPRPLTRYLAKLARTLDSTDLRMAAILARNSPLPLTVLAQFALDGQTAAKALRRLIDISLVIPDPATSWYRISDPVTDYIDRHFPACTVEDYGLLADELDKFLDEDRNTGAYLELSRVLYRALVHAGKDQRPRAHALVADWLRLAEEYYHQRDYKRALTLATMANEEVPSHQSLSWVVRANVKLGNYDSARSSIDAMRDYGQSRDANFLQGFLERNRGNYQAAVGYYERAQRAGRSGLGLERDLAECYFQLGDFVKADQFIQSAQRRQPDNRYVLSLRIKIACGRSDEATARRLLPLLEEVDSPAFAAHRRSRVELRFGEVAAAYHYARKAADEPARPPAEALTNLAHCEILMGKPQDGLSTLSRLESLYGNVRWRDVVNGLRALAAVAERRYEAALDLCDLLSRDSLTHMRLKRDALRGLLDHAPLAPPERQSKEHLLLELQTRLAARGPGKDSTNYWDITDL